MAFASHRAVYDLKLAQSRGTKSISGVRGRIVYDFSGNACEGYALSFRQVTELDNGEGKVAVSDLRSATWEEGAGKSYRFNFQNFISQELVDSADGRADRRSDAIGVHVAKPEDKRFDLDAAVVFPTEHMRRIIEAAREGKTVLELQVFDGSENGEKLYNTLTVIGHIIAPDEKKPDRRGRRPGRARGAQALARHHQLFRQGGQRRRADAGLRDHVRALRERDFPRALARLRRLHHLRRDDDAGDQGREALPVRPLAI